MKKFFHLLLTFILVISFSSSAFAASKEMPTSGKVKLTNSEVTPFTVVNVGGGTWNYGTETNGSTKHVWSYYIHPSKPHSSTAIIGPVTDYEEQIAGYWSYADAYGAWYETGYAYWNTWG